MRISRTLLCGLAILLGGCASGGDEVAGNSGGGIEIPNGLVVVVKDQAGKLAAHATVRLVAASDWSSRLASGHAVLLDSAETDSLGVAHLHHSSVGADAWVEARSIDQGTRVGVLEQNRMDLSMASLKTISGTWPSSLARPQKLWLAGTLQSAVLDSSGRYRFDSVIQGSFSLVAGYPTFGLMPAGQVQIGAAGVQRLAVSLDTAGVVLDDFEDGDVLWKQGDLFGPGYWWVSADSKLHLVDVYGVTEAKTLVKTDASGNHYFHAAPMLDTSVPGAWANFGVNLGEDVRSFPDIHAMTSVRVRLRGQGTWTLSLNVRGPNGMELWRTTLVVDSSWKQVEVLPTQFKQVEGVAGGVLTKGPRRLTMPVFQLTGPGWLDVDDLTLVGVTLSDWGK